MGHTLAVPLLGLPAPAPLSPEPMRVALGEVREEEETVCV